MKPYYQDSAVTIFHGDSREIVPQLGKFDLLLTDPPYGLRESNPVKRSSRGRLKAKIPLVTRYAETSEWDAEPADRILIQRVVEKALHSIVWGGNYFHFPPSKCWLVWNKLNSGDFADCELAWTNLSKAVRKFDFLWNGMIRGGEQHCIPRVHPTQKPVELMRWCLSLAPDSLTIVDPFMGSGTTLRAAKDLGRKAVGIEIEEQYCEIAAKRMSQEVLQFSENKPLTPP
jgi:DNA modification methylase